MTDEGHPYRVGCECADCDLVTADRAGEALAAVVRDIGGAGERTGDALFAALGMAPVLCECGGRTWARKMGGVVCVACHRMREDS